MNKQKIALIFGLNGQIGSYYAKLLLKKGYKVAGVIRKNSNLHNLKFLKIYKKLNIFRSNYSFSNIVKIIKKSKPNEIYNFSGVSDIPLSWEKPYETYKSNFIFVKNLINYILIKKLNIKVFLSNSIQILKSPQTANLENLKSKNISPYVKSKINQFKFVKKIRKLKKLKIYNGFFSNTESVLRPKNYILPKLCVNALNIYRKKIKKFSVGNINVARDWGWCEEFCEIIFKIMSLKPDDFIIATGKVFKLKEMLNYIFQYLNLNWQDHIIIDKKLIRKYEIKKLKANIKKTSNATSIKPKVYGKKLIIKLLKFYEKK